MLGKEEIERFKRQLLLPEMGEKGQLALKNARVLVIGAGGLGNVVCAYLAAAGVGNLTIIDHDTVDSSNLQRQVMFTNSDIGLPKAERLVYRLQQLNEFGNFEYLNHKITSSNCIKLTDKQDLIIDCVDEVSIRYLLNDVAVFRNIPLVYGAIHRFEGQVSVFNFKESGTYRCAFPEKFGKQKAPNCEEIGVIGVLPGVIGLYQAMEAIKIITGMGKVLANQMLLIDLMKTSHTKMGFKRNPKAIEIAKANMDGLSGHENEYNTEIQATEMNAFLNSHPNTQIIDIQEDLSKKHWGDQEVKHIPDYYFQDQIQAFDRNQTILVYCEKGIKSKWAIQVMKSLDFKNIYQLSGGLSSVTELE